MAKHAFLRASLLVCSLWAAPPLVVAQPTAGPSPAQAAQQAAESRRIEAQFVAEVAAIAGVAEAQVRALLPDERRISSTLDRVVQGLEQQLGRPLSASQQQALQSAHARRLAALSALR